ncbi:MAG: hypothetical protein ACYCZA_10105 [Thiobacillus sp.]
MLNVRSGAAFLFLLVRFLFVAGTPGGAVLPLGRSAHVVSRVSLYFHLARAELMPFADGIDFCPFACVGQRLLDLGSGIDQKTLATDVDFRLGGMADKPLDDHAINGQGGVPGAASISSTDQSELRSQIDLKGLYRDADADRKLVCRADDSRSFLDTRPSRNRILSAYYEYKGYQNGFSAKVGRQTPTSGGVLGRFDGAQLGYEFAPDWRANVVAGMPVDFPTLETNRTFWGVSLDADNLTERLRAKTYFIDQTADGIVDRRAVGLEMGFYDARGSISSLLDYDISYSVLNIGTLQSNWQSEGGSSFNFGLDYRRSQLRLPCITPQ